jgi:hypothetical protein
MAKIVKGATLLIPAVSTKLNDKGEITDIAITQALKSLLNVVFDVINKY